jgi:rare lipoprotein A
MMQPFRISLLIVLALLSAACGGMAVPHPPPAAAGPSVAPATEPVYRETGTASWYGKELHGRKTASGEMFDMYALSAAHRTLPFGTIIRVTNLDNLKSVSVKISNRGPFIKSRVLEVSYGAAQELGFVAQGTVRVTIETLEEVHAPSLYTVQAATFAEEENARLLKERIRRKFEGVSIVTFETNLARFFRVLVGSYASQERAEQAASKLMLEGLEPIVMRKD